MEVAETKLSYWTFRPNVLEATLNLAWKPSLGQVDFNLQIQEIHLRLWSFPPNHTGFLFSVITTFDLDIHTNDLNLFEKGSSHKALFILPPNELLNWSAPLHSHSSHAWLQQRAPHWVSWLPLLPLRGLEDSQRDYSRAQT